MMRDQPGRPGPGGRRALWCGPPAEPGHQAAISKKDRSVLQAVHGLARCLDLLAAKAEGLSLQDWAARGRWQGWQRVSGSPSSFPPPRPVSMNMLGSPEYNL